jgi:putative endonuclease
MEFFHKQTLGNLGEKIAANYLIRQGYKIIGTNYKTKLGEIDIIAQEDNILVFVEVKTRSTKTFGLPQEAVNFKKQNKIMRIGMMYLSDHNINLSWRIDVVAIVMDNRTHKVENIELIRNAVTR